MALKELHDLAVKEATTDEREMYFYSTRVLPVVTKLAARINTDPDLKVTFQVASDDGGYRIHHGFRRWWGFAAQFRNKADDSDAGRALLRLSERDPEIAVMAGSYEATDLRTEEGSRKAIEDLVLWAAEDLALAQMEKRRASKIMESNGLLSGPAKP
jgi:hypothetical protein